MTALTMYSKKRIAIVAQENQKTELIEWSYSNRKILEQQTITATGGSAHILEGTLNMPVVKLPGVNFDGIQELEKMIQEKEIDVLVFFPNINEQLATDDKVQSLLTIAAEQNLLIAFNMTTADLFLQSLVLSKDYTVGQNGYDIEIATLRGIS